jgi:riboflavin biosynthesis pyrimidine reductase
MLPPVRQLFPVAVDDVDVEALYRRAERAGPRWLLVNMISSLDGATAVAGRSGALGGPSDKRVFTAIRGTADVILVGAGTVRAEDYGPPAGGARLAIVTGSLDIDPRARLFRGGYRPTIITHASTDPARREALAEVADVVVFGEHRVDLAAAVASFDGVIVCEGGPSLNGDLVAAGLVDEMCLTVSPMLVSGESPRAAHGLQPHEPARLDLSWILEDGGFLFVRYVRPVSGASARSTS